MNSILPSKSSWEFSKKKNNAILLSRSSKYTFKCPIIGENISLILIIMIINLLILSTLKMVLGWNTLAYQTCCVLALQDLLQIILLLVNIGQDFSPIYWSYTHVVILFKTRIYILHEYVQYMKLWNIKRKSLKDVPMFLKFNPGAFCFQKGIT